MSPLSHQAGVVDLVTVVNAFLQFIYNNFVTPIHRSDPTVKEVVTDLASDSPFTDRFSGRTPDCGSGDAISIIADLTSITFLRPVLEWGLSGQRFFTGFSAESVVTRSHVLNVIRLSTLRKRGRW